LDSEKGNNAFLKEKKNFIIRKILYFHYNIMEKKDKSNSIRWFFNKETSQEARKTFH